MTTPRKDQAAKHALAGLTWPQVVGDLRLVQVMPGRLARALYVCTCGRECIRLYASIRESSESGAHASCKICAKQRRRQPRDSWTPKPFDK